MILDPVTPICQTEDMEEITTTKEEAMTTPTLDLALATEAQIGLYTKLVNEFVELTGYDRVAADEAIAKFPSMSVKVASGRIERVINSLKKARTERPEAVEVKEVDPVLAVWTGTYTVVDEATGDRRTFKVTVQPSDAKFAPSATILSVLNGPDNNSDYLGFAFLDGKTVRPWKRFRESADLLRFAEMLVADPDKALVAKACARCGETLTVPESIAAGFGPVCVKKGFR